MAGGWLPFSNAELEQGERCWTFCLNKPLDFELSSEIHFSKATEYKPSDLLLRADDYVIVFTENRFYKNF